MGFPIAVIIIIFILFVGGGLLAYLIRVVPQAEAYVIERLGAYSATWTTGVHFLVPIIDRVAKRVTLKEIISDFPPQPVITRDNVTIKIDTVVYYVISDPKLYTYGVVSPLAAIETLSATTLRNIIGDLELDETLTSRDLINTKMRAVLDEATDAWGIKVTRVEVQNIIPPSNIQEAMEKQMRAERERRESILRAEGEKHSAILLAEGEKESMLLRASATKEATITEAEGRAQALQLQYQAEALGIKTLQEAKPSKEYLTIKALEAYGSLANGEATTIVVPAEFQELATLLTTAKELTGASSKKKDKTKD